MNVSKNDSRLRTLLEHLDRVAFILSLLVVAILVGIYFIIAPNKSWIEFVIAIITNLIPTFLLFAGSFVLIRKFQKVRSEQDTDDLVRKIVTEINSSDIDLLQSGYPNFTEYFRAAKHIRLVGVILSNTVTRYSSEFVQSLQKETTIKFILSSPTPEVGAMQTFRSSLIKDRDYLPRATYSVVETIKAIGRKAPRPGLLEVRGIPYLPSCSMVIIDGDDGVSRAWIRIQTFRTPAPEQPVIMIDSSLNSKWFTFFSDQFKSLWDASVEI